MNLLRARARRRRRGDRRHRRAGGRCPRDCAGGDAGRAARAHRRSRSSAACAQRRRASNIWAPIRCVACRVGAPRSRRARSRARRRSRAATPRALGWARGAQHFLRRRDAARGARSTCEIVSRRTHDRVASIALSSRGGDAMMHTTIASRIAARAVRRGSSARRASRRRRSKCRSTTRSRSADRSPRSSTASPPISRRRIPGSR